MRGHAANAHATNAAATSARAATGSTAHAYTRRWIEPAYYAGVGLAAFAAIFVVLRLWLADLRIPLDYTGDAMFGGATFRGMIDNGLAWVNPHLGAPGSMNLLDYPGTDFLHYAAMRIISVFAGQWALVANLYYLLGFVVVALAAVWSLRRLGVSRPAAFAAAVLYTVLPFHFLHGQTHIFLSFYFQVPLLCVLAIELQGAIAPLVTGEGAQARLDLDWCRAWLPALICALTGMAGIYYALFGCFFLALGGVRGWWRTRERARLFSAGVLIGVILVVTLACLTPYVWYRHSAGSNPQVAARSFVETEVYGAKIAQLVLPVRDHRIALFARVREHYVSVIAATFGRFTDSESDFIALGIVGALGFIGLIAVAVLGWRRRSGDGDGGPDRVPLDAVAALTVAGTLLATVGGFGTVIGLGFTQIRAYARISVFLAFFALLAVCVFFDWAMRKAPKGSAQTVSLIAAALLIIVGVLDQTTAAMVPAYSDIRASWKSTGGFVSAIEQGMPDGAEVFQLPYVPFPENPPVANMSDYDHFKPYLQSAKIHWSYGAVKGREAATWNEKTASLPAGQMLSALRGKGFVGVWIDRAGYADQGSAVLTELRKATGEQARFSDDNRYAYFALGK